MCTVIDHRRRHACKELDSVSCRTLSFFTRCDVICDLLHTRENVIYLLKAVSHEAICPCNLHSSFCRNKYCRLQLGCQTYATCFATCNEIIFYARREYLKMSAAFWLCRIVIGSFSKSCETSCSGGVTRCNLSRSIAKSRSCFYFLCDLQRNFSLRD